MMGPKLMSCCKPIQRVLCGRMRGGVEVELLASAHYAAGCLEVKFRVFMDDIIALLVDKNKVVAKMAKKVMKRLREEVERKGLKLSVNENEKEWKSKMIASCGFLEDELRQCSKEEGVTMADRVETLGVDFRTRVKSLGVKEKARRKMCKVRFSVIKKNKAFQKNYMKVGVKKLFRAGMVPARTWGVHAVGSAPQKDSN